MSVRCGIRTGAFPTVHRDRIIDRSRADFIRSSLRQTPRSLPIRTMRAPTLSRGSYAAIAIPNFVPARYTSVGQPLSVRVRVADRDGVPIEGATIRATSGGESAVANMDGECEIIARFPAHGVVGRSGTMQLSGGLQVTAPGYQPWERSFVSLFGQEIDYVRQVTVLTQTVVMAK